MSDTVSDAPQRRHALSAWRSQAVEPQHPAGARVELYPEYDYLNLRGDPQLTSFVQTVEAALGQALPVPAKTFTTGAHCIFWLGPDEWLLRTGAGGAKSLAQCLRDGLAGQCYSLVDLSGGQFLLRLSGDGARNVLAKSSTLDYHPRVFKVGQCARTALAKTTMLIALVDETPTFDIIVPCSFAEYAVCWLQQAGAVVAQTQSPDC